MIAKAYYSRFYHVFPFTSSYLYTVIVSSFGCISVDREMIVGKVLKSTLSASFNDVIDRLPRPLFVNESQFIHDGHKPGTRRT